jgi:hypothetical protein
MQAVLCSQPVGKEPLVLFLDHRIALGAFEVCGGACMSLRVECSEREFAGLDAATRGEPSARATSL